VPLRERSRCSRSRANWRPGSFWPKLIALGTLNTGLLFALVFIAVLRLPGGVAGTFRAFGPLFSIVLVWPLLGHRPTAMKIASHPRHWRPSCARQCIFSRPRRSAGAKMEAAAFDAWVHSLVHCVNEMAPAEYGETHRRIST